MSEHHHSHHVSGKKLFITILLNVVITLSQVVGGLMSGSLALLSDAVHNLSDVLALVIAYVANRLSLRPSSETKTFGYRRAEILATLFNASALIGIAVFIMIEAAHKLYHPEVVNSVWVIALGVLSIVLNAVSVLLIKDDAHHNMNMRAAYLHLLTDVMTSVAVVVGGLLIYFFELYWVDPVVSVLIALYLVKASVGLVLESGGILMQFTPDDVDINAVVAKVLEEEAILNIHHIHLWQLDDHHVHLEAHLDFRENLTLEVSSHIVSQLVVRVKNSFKITHITFQTEFNTKDDKALLSC